MADATYGPKVYHKQGGDELVVASGGTLTVESGGLLSVAGVNAAQSVTFSAAAGSANVCEVTITVKDGAGTAIAAPFHLDVFLSDAATGVGLTGTTASGTVVAKSASGTDLATLVSKKALRVQTLGTGIYILQITDTAKTGFYVCAALGSKVFVSSVLVTGNYG